MPTGRLRARRRDGYRPLYNVGSGGGYGGADRVGIMFELPLSDLGAGAVDTTPTIAWGSPTPTFTRATVAWTKLSTGLWAQVASGTARSGYTGANTAVGAYGGYFVEGVGTQLVTPTASIRDMTDGSWVATTMTVAHTATGIDGVVNSASTLTATGAGATLLQTLTAAASSRTYSAWIRRVTGSGTVKLVQGATKSSDLAASINTSTYTRCELNASVLNAAFGIELGTSGDVVEVDFNQFEAGSFATSPMASAGAARNADVLTYPTSGNISLTDSTAYAEVVGNNGASFGYVITDSANVSVPLFYSTVAATYDGTNTVNTANTVSTSSINKIASSWAGSTLKVVGNGGTVASGSFDGSMNLTSIGIGAGTQHEIYGTMRNARIYNCALSSAQLQAMTT